jgi:hypothetical protein
MEIIINNDYGGWGISNLALIELIKRKAKCIETFTPEKYYGSKARWDEDFKTRFTEVSNGYYVNDTYCLVYKGGMLYDVNTEKARTDKDLIDILKTMGKKAHGSLSLLKIVEIPDGINYEIDDYDGVESIHEIHRSWG